MMCNMHACVWHLSDLVKHTLPFCAQLTACYLIGFFYDNRWTLSNSCMLHSMWLKGEGVSPWEWN